MEAPRFTDWLPLPEGEREAPQEEGVFQVRVAEGLLRYPNGRSAMVFYGRAGDLRGGVRLFRERLLPGLEWAEPELRVRWFAEPDAAQRMEQLLRRFEQRFGGLPHGNRALI